MKTFFMLLLLFYPSICYAQESIIEKTVKGIVYVFGLLFVGVLHLLFLLPIFYFIYLFVYGLILFPIIDRKNKKEFIEKNNLKYIELTSKLPPNIDFKYIKFDGNRVFHDVFISTKLELSYMLMDVKYTYANGKVHCGTCLLHLLIIIDKNQNFPYFNIKEELFNQNIRLYCDYGGKKINLKSKEEYEKRLSLLEDCSLTIEEDHDFVNRFRLFVDPNQMLDNMKFFNSRIRSIFKESAKRECCYEGNGNLFIVCSCDNIYSIDGKKKFLEENLNLYRKIIS